MPVVLGWKLGINFQNGYGYAGKLSKLLTSDRVQIKSGGRKTNIKILICIPTGRPKYVSMLGLIE